MVKDKIISFLRSNGPSLPVEINKQTGYDTFINLAVLGELVKDKIVRQSKRPIGSSLIYYLPEHEERMREKLFTDLSIPEKKVLMHIREAGKLTADELSPHERAFLDMLRDYIRVEQLSNTYVVYYYSYNGPKAVINPVNTQVITPVTPPVINPVKVTPVEQIPPKIEPVKTHEEIHELKKNDDTKSHESSNFEKKIIKHLEELGEIISSTKIKANTEYDYALKTKKPFPQEFLVKAKNKKSINETDLSMIYADALKNKKTAILITNGKLTTKAKKWKDANAGELIKIIEI